MGFYPVTPGIPAYSIGSPVKLQNSKTFRILAQSNSRQNKYIQKAILNGKPWTKPWFSWDDIKNGGVLVLEMGPKPNYLWGAAPGDAPPSGLN